MSEKNIIQFSNAVPESEILLLRKWNCRLLPKELSKKFIQLVLNEDPQMDPKKTKRKWTEGIILSKNGLFYEPDLRSTYMVQTKSGRDLLHYFVKDSDSEEFERDMWTVWSFLQNCYDKEWWQKEYGEYAGEGEVLFNDLYLMKSTTIIWGGIEGCIVPTFRRLL